MGKRFSIVNALRASAFVALLGIGSLAVGQSASAAALTCSWTGAGGDNLFSTAANWEGCGGAAPSGGSKLVFKYAKVTDEQQLTNDIDAAFGGVILEGTSESTNFKYIYISALKLVSGGFTSSTLSGNLSASIATGSGASYEDRELVAEGDVTLGDSFYFRNIKASGNVTVKAGASFSHHPDNSLAKLVLEEGARLNFHATDTNNVVSYPIEMNGGDGNQFGAQCAEFTGGNGMGFCSRYNDTTWRLTGTVTVNKNTTLSINNSARVIFAGTVNGKDKLSKSADSEDGVLQFGDEVVVTPPSVELKGELDDRYNVPKDQVATLIGKRASIFVHKGGVLKGTGIVSGSLFVSDGGVVAPGMSPGCLTVGSLSLYGEYQVEIGGKEACVGHDQIKVTSVGSYSAQVINAKLSVYGFGDFVQTKGDQFVIIDVAGTDQVTGTFKDLPEGAEVKAGNAVFTISYKGGDGNDVVLTAQNSVAAPKVPNTGFKMLTSSPIVAAVAAVAGVVAVAFLFKRASARK